MYYKIVETIENNKKLLSIIPEAWEVGNILFWPPKNVSKGDFHRLINDYRSKPGAGWIEMSCLKKRDNIASYQTAEGILSEMLHETDSDSPDVLPQTGRCARPFATTNVDLNEDMENLVQSKITAVPQSDENIEPVDSKSLQPIFISEGDVSSYIDTRISTILPSSSVCNDKIDRLLAAMTGVSNTLARLEAKIDTLGKIVSSEMVSPRSNPVIAPSIVMMRTTEDVDNFEGSLSSPQFMDEMKNAIRTIIGSEPKNGTNLCYIIVDRLFCRELFLNYSWSGGTRNSEYPKKRFATYHNIFKLFFEVVRLNDAAFSELKLQQFFKQILKNAVSRCEVSIRQSATKSRRCSKRKDNSSEEQPNA